MGAKLILSLIIPFTAGYTFVLYLFSNHKLSLAFKMALAYGAGLGLLAIWMLFLGMMQFPFSFLNMAIPLLIFSTILIFLIGRNSQNSTEAHEKAPLTTADINPPVSGVRRIAYFFIHTALILYILENVYLIFWRATSIPIRSWDALSTISFKAKIFYFEQYLPDLNLLRQKTYPLLVSFLQSWIAFALGAWNDQFVKIIFPFALLSFLFIFYAFLKYYTDKTWALLGCVILASSNFFFYHATISYTDFFLMYYNCLTIILLVFWYRIRSSAYLILSAFFAGFATFVKLEGTAFLLIYLTIFAMINFLDKASDIKSKLKNLLLFTVPSIGICLSFHIYKLLNNVLVEGSGYYQKTKIDFTLEKLHLIPTILKSIAGNLFLSGNWNIIWVIFCLSLFHVWRKRKNAEMWLVLLSVFLFFALYSMVALLTVNYIYIAGELKTQGLSRILLHFFPLGVAAIILLNYPKTYSKK